MGSLWHVVAELRMVSFLSHGSWTWYVRRCHRQFVCNSWTVQTYDMSSNISLRSLQPSKDVSQHHCARCQSNVSQSQPPNFHRQREPVCTSQLKRSYSIRSCGRRHIQSFELAESLRHSVAAQHKTENLTKHDVRIPNDRSEQTCANKLTY